MKLTDPTGPSPTVKDGEILLPVTRSRHLTNIEIILDTSTESKSAETPTSEDPADTANVGNEPRRPPLDSPENAAPSLVRFLLHREYSWT